MNIQTRWNITKLKNSIFVSYCRTHTRLSFTNQGHAINRNAYRLTVNNTKGFQEEAKQGKTAAVE